MLCLLFPNFASCERIFSLPKIKHDQKVTFPQVLSYSHLFQDFPLLIILHASPPLGNQ